MSNAAIKLTEPDAGQLSTALCLAPSNSPAPIYVYQPQIAQASTNRLLILTSVLITLQVLDGILTYTGIHTFGIQAEGNPLLKSLMQLVGIIPAIALTKAFCIGVTIALCSQAKRISWLPLALGCIAGMYAVAAVLPWSWILLAEYLA